MGRSGTCPTGLLENELGGGTGERDVFDLMIVAVFVPYRGVQILGIGGLDLHVGFDAGLSLLYDGFVFLDLKLRFADLESSTVHNGGLVEIQIEVTGGAGDCQRNHRNE